MEKYRKMYAILCVAASKALDVLPEILENQEGRKILKEALLLAEDMYIKDDD